MKSGSDLHSYFFNTKCWNSLILQQLKLRVQRCLACSERKAWHCSYSWEFFFGEAVSSQHSGCLAVVLGRSVLIFPLGSTLPLCVSVSGSAAEAAASASPPGQVGKNAPLGDSPPSVTLISCRWLAWDVSGMCHTARGPDEKAGLPGAPGFPTSRGHSEALCHLGNLGPRTRVRCPRTQKQHSSGRQRQKNTGMGTCLGVDVQACSASRPDTPSRQVPHLTVGCSLECCGDRVQIGGGHYELQMLLKSEHHLHVLLFRC